ncbi:MAG TPA: 5-methyltetrahydropteroyltriglutamate--homocysteine S-methyltransferase [Candidatus Binatia bacterium]|nr:5-methyltetrahydropteroyltriglutamate--homocysteine S-methyltransferase [Candidatus Binatia bacterium]
MNVKPSAPPNPPFRAEHIGSLLRPRELKHAFRAHAELRLDDAGLREVQDRLIRDAVRLQEDVGLQSITDGEFRRTAWSAGFVWALDGLVPRDSLFEFTDERGDRVGWQTCYAEGRVNRTRGIATEEFAFVRPLTERTVKVTMPAPSFLHFFRGPQCANPAVYPDLELFWSDLVEIYRAEIADLARLGCRYVQLDEVPMAMLCDTSVRDKVRSRGEDPDALIRTYVSAVNRVLAARPAGMTIGMHLCRGNLRGHWMAAGGYDAIAERLFNDLAVDAFFLEYDTPRAGDFSALRHMAKDKRVILGLVSTKTPTLEGTDTLKQRIEDASRYVPIERLGISPQCGFASTIGGNPLREDDERAKLARIVEVASAVWE